MNNSSNLARVGLFDTVNAGLPIENYLNSINGDRQAFFNASVALVDIFLALRHAKPLTGQVNNEGLSGFLQATRSVMVTQVQAAMNGQDLVRAGQLVSALTTLVSSNRTGLIFNETTPTPAPVKMEITAMPTRNTSTVIKRDSNDEIKSTSQTERDA